MRIGIIGAGQLGRMMALAGIPLGLRFTMYDRRADVPGAAVAPVVTGEFDDRRALARFARGVDVVTFDWENVPADAVRMIAGHARVYAPPRALADAQDRLGEKRLFRKLGIPVAPHAAVSSRIGLARALASVGAPGLLKTRRLGYDGKGQVVLDGAADADAAWRRLGGVPLIYERRIRFERELSLLAVRDRAGRVACYPLCENRHEDGILSCTRAPWDDARLERSARRHAGQLLRALGYVGVLCIEFFVEHGRLVANEIAPRVHNSGHWTIEGAETSQFENHVRAIAGLPLGSTRPRGHAVMVNLVGQMPDASSALAAPGLHWHDYGKAARPGRKLGHLTRICETRRERDRVMRQMLRMAAPRRAR